MAALLVAGATSPARSQATNQPRVTPGPVEPDWVAILEGIYGLDMVEDLLNPVETTPEATPGLFRKAGGGPVTYTPVIALGLETVNRGGLYVPGAEPGRPTTRELWAYRFKNTGQDLERGENLPPPLMDGSTVEIDPGDRTFGFWVANDGLGDGGVFTQPSEVRAINARLAPQPYKAMIYPYRDPETRELVPNSYLIGWEYSTNDDFQDVVCRVDNVELVQDER
jgi:hypothetical protein